MLLKSLFGSREALAIRSDIGPLSQVPGVLYANSQRSASGARVSELESLSLSGVFAACNLLTAVLGTLPLSVYRQSGRSRSVADAHSANRVLHTQLNPEMTAAVGRRTLEFHRLLWGNAYGEIGWDGGGNVRAIWPIEPWRVKLERDEGGLYYRVDGGRKVAAADMIHVPLISCNGVKGLSFVDFAIDSLGLGLSTQEFAGKFFGNGARPGGILKHAASHTVEARKAFREEWQRNHGGTENAGKVAVVWGGWDYIPNDGAFNAQESQLLEQRRFTIEEVARWFNIPPHMLRELSRSTNNNIEQQGIDLVLYSFGPVLVMYEQEYDRKLLNPPQLYSKHNVAALLRGDSAARSAYYREMTNLGAFSINDVLELEERNPIEGGDTHFVPLNMVPLERALEPPPKPAPAPVPGAGQGAGQAPVPGAPPGRPQPGRGRGLAIRELLADAFTRMLRVECAEVSRVAAKPGKFLSWLEGFYPEHEGRLVEAIQPVLRVCRPDDAGLTAALARGWVNRSRLELLDDAGEATPAQFAAVIERRLNDWKSTRAAELAAAVMEGHDDADDADHS